MTITFKDSIAIIRLGIYGAIALFGYQHQQEIVDVLRRWAGQPPANVVCVGSPPVPVVLYVTNKSPAEPKVSMPPATSQPDWVSEVFRIGH